MKRRALAFLLCLCLCISAAGFSAGQTVMAESASNYIIAQLDARISTSVTLSNNEAVYAESRLNMDALDLTEYGYAEDPSRIALQLDTYVGGDEKFVEYVVKGGLRGQVEIASGGNCDAEELSSSAEVIPFAGGKWIRSLIPLSSLKNSYGGDFRPEHLDYFRIYLQDLTPKAYVGVSGSIKIANPCLVDTSVPESERPDESEFPLGDGTFMAEDPVFDKAEITPGYDDSVAVFAGYNLKEYIAEHPEIKVKDANGNYDYSGVVNSLLDGLQRVGGGTLFIPAGEWEFRHEIILPPGTSIHGEWANPDDNPVIRGTILKVYCGANAVAGTPFITMGHHTKVQNLSIWYPEQKATAIVEYPPTILTSHYTFAQNITLVNSYLGIVNSGTANCPNAWNIYGTPLSVGLDFDMVVDIARVEELHFSADYWVNSGLSGAPASAEALQALEEQLYNYGIGVVLRRIDWSYLTYTDVSGYNIGLMFDESIDAGFYPNGQCVALNLTNCKYGVFSYGVNYSTEAISEFVIRGCEYGVYLAEHPQGKAEGALHIYNSDIQATKYAVYQNSLVKLNLTSSVVRGGEVKTENGNNTFINNKFLTAAPQIVLDYGTVAGILIGNTDAYNEAITYRNPGLCTLGYDAARADIDPYVPMTREEAAGRVVGPANKAYVIVSSLDNTGESDVTEALQETLTALGENGGGTLFLVPGNYRLDGTLTVPSGVELRGSGDFATIPMAANTYFSVYTPIADGENAATATATVTLQENSGIRGIIFNYPLQNSTYRKTDTVVDPVASAEQGVEVTVDYYEFDFVPYPYTVRGTGADVYLVNVTIRNGWNGVDLATYRCDDHYVDYLAGHFYHRGIVVGHGGTGGYIRNFQFNYNSIYAPFVDVWFGFGGVPEYELQAKFHQPMQAQFNNNSILLQLGHVSDQLVYNCFNYSGFIGVHLIAEETGAADARIFGHGVDFGTQAVKIEAADHVEFVNLQLTSFNQFGSDANTKRYVVDQTVTPMYDIFLTDTFTGEVNVYNLSEWGSTPNAAVRVDGGVLNLYNGHFNNNGVPTFELHKNGVVNVLGPNFVTTSGSHYIESKKPPIAVGETKNLHVAGGFWQNEMAGTETLGTFDKMYPFKTRYSVPKNALFPENGTIVAVESFDSYAFDDTAPYKADNTTAVTIRRGAVRMRLQENQLAVNLYSEGNSANGYPFMLTDGLYRMEWRVNMEELRATSDSEVYFHLLNNAQKNMVALTVDKDGKMMVNGNSIGRIDCGTYYRIALEVDTRRADNKTVRVFLLNDKAETVAAGPVVKMPANFQGTNTVCGFRIGAMAMPYEGSGTETDLYVDYFYVLQSEESTLSSGMLGDVNGDGKIDSTDARLTLQYAVKKVTSLPNETAADVSGDGKVDSTDARLILQYAVKKISKFPAA